MRRVMILVSDKMADKLVTLLCTGRVTGHAKDAYQAFNLLNYAGPHKRGRRPNPRRKVWVEGVAFTVPHCYSYGGRR